MTKWRTKTCLSVVLISVLMDSKKVLQSRKCKRSRRSLRFSEMARHRWSNAVFSTVDGNIRANEDRDEDTEVGTINSIDGSRKDETTGGDNDSGMICEINYEEPINDNTSETVSLIGNTEMVVENYEELMGNSGETVSLTGCTALDNIEFTGIVENAADVVDLCLFGDKTSFEMELSSTNDVSTSESEIVESSSEYLPTPLKKPRVSSIKLGNSVFLCQTTQLEAFIDEINATALCYTPMCNGKLVPVSVKHVGLGGSTVVKFSCTGCTEWMLNLVSSADIAFSRRSLQSCFTSGIYSWWLYAFPI